MNDKTNDDFIFDEISKFITALMPKLYTNAKSQNEFTKFSVLSCMTFVSNIVLNLFEKEQHDLIIDFICETTKGAMKEGEVHSIESINLTPKNER